MRKTHQINSFQRRFVVFWVVFASFTSFLIAQETRFSLPEPHIENGQAQIVEAFRDSKDWIRHDLWVETEFDSDGDGKPDRMHVAVTRPSATEKGLRLPVIYESSPYYGGTAKAQVPYSGTSIMNWVRLLL